MSEEELQARIVLTTADNPKEATGLARTLVEEGLAACATLIPAVQSIYRWQGRLEHTNETMLLLKTGEAKVEQLKARLMELHSYEVPEFLVLEVESGSQTYLKWLQAGLSTNAEATGEGGE